MKYNEAVGHIYHTKTVFMIFTLYLQQFLPSILYQAQ